MIIAFKEKLVLEEKSIEFDRYFNTSNLLDAGFYVNPENVSTLVLNFITVVDTPLTVPPVQIPEIPESNSVNSKGEVERHVKKSKDTYAHALQHLLNQPQQRIISRPYSITIMGDEAARINQLLSNA